jgi:hypothetical protein
MKLAHKLDPSLNLNALTLTGNTLLCCAASKMDVDAMEVRYALQTRPPCGPLFADVVSFDHLWVLSPKTNSIYC